MDVTNVEQCSIIIIYFDTLAGCIKGHFYKMPMLTMISVIAGLYKRLKDLQPNLYSMWCIYHQLHFVEKKTVDPFSGDVHDLPVEI